jgi:Kef-type K+ transport system membrane component KefB
LTPYFFIELAIILAGTKLLGYITKNLRMTNVAGALIAGVFLGPAVLGLINKSEFIVHAAGLGVVVLMFTAGLETDMEELRKCGFAAFVIALFGVLLPLGASYFISRHVFSLDTLQSLFIGVVLTSTSVSITAETLQQLGRMRTKSAAAIMGACIIDDILGIMLLSIITSMAVPQSSSSKTFVHIGLFFLFSAVSIKALPGVFNVLCSKEIHRARMPFYAFIFCLIMAFVSEYYFSISSIIGAYLAGAIISTTSQCNYVKRKINALSYLLLSPIFFASIGVKTEFIFFDTSLFLFTIILFITAVLTKLAGCGVGALLCGYSLADSSRIGIGMVSRGEVALIIINLGAVSGLISQQIFTPIVLIVLVTTLITPILLSNAYRVK